MPGIVVGVDGSDRSRHALEWAIGEAALRNASLEVIAVRQVAVDNWGLNPLHMPTDEKEREQVRAAAQQMVDKTAAQVGYKRPPSVHVRAITGIPAEVLLDVSRDADLLVLGSRGAGSFRRMLLGSVTSHIVHHAVCPVTVIPPRKEADRPAAAPAPT
jgi:nucleotide-binding universal stress UspA family protein